MAVKSVCGTRKAPKTFVKYLGLSLSIKCVCEITSELPQFIKLRESEFVVSASLELDVKLEIIEKAGLSEITGTRDYAAFVAIAFGKRHDIDLCVQVLRRMRLDFQFT